MIVRSFNFAHLQYRWTMRFFMIRDLPPVVLQSITLLSELLLRSNPGPYLGLYYIVIWIYTGIMYIESNVPPVSYDMDVMAAPLRNDGLSMSSDEELVSKMCIPNSKSKK